MQVRDVTISRWCIGCDPVDLVELGDVPTDLGVQILECRGCGGFHVVHALSISVEERNRPRAARRARATAVARRARRRRAAP